MPLKKKKKSFAIKATGTKEGWYWHKDRRIHQRSGTESPEINAHVHGQLLFGKSGKGIQ